MPNKVAYAPLHLRKYREAYPAASAPTWSVYGRDVRIDIPIRESLTAAPDEPAKGPMTSRQPCMHVITYLPFQKVVEAHVQVTPTIAIVSSLGTRA